jgi:TolB protein
LFRTSPDSSGEQNIPSGLIGDYSWSPDGEKIVLSSNSDIFVGNTSNQNWENISYSLDVDERMPVWSKDGNFIYFLSCTQNEFGMGSCKLAQSRFDGKDKLFLLEKIENSINTFAISPDGETIIFSASHGGFDRLYQSNFNGANVELITTSEVEEISPAFSPDGKRIAFVRNNNPILLADMKEISDLILRDLKTGGEKNLTDKLDETVSSPVFSIDGKWLAFTSFDDNLDANIFIVSIDEAIIHQVTQGINDKTNPSWRLNNAK